MPNTNDKDAYFDSDEARVDQESQNDDNLDVELQNEQSYKSDENDLIDDELSQIADSNNNVNNKDNESELELDPEQINDLDVNKLDKQEEQKTVDENVKIPKSKIVLAKKLLTNIKENNDRLIQILSGLISSEDEAMISIGQMSDDQFEPSNEKTAENKIIEGVFDGENMIGPDGKQYSVPANYASKSKLVEGDILKLTITADGTFIYKQIGPIERSRIVGELERSSDGGYIAAANDENWRILTASITYFKGEPGDEIVILIPKTGKSKWATVENIVKKNEL